MKVIEGDIGLVGGGTWTDGGGGGKTVLSVLEIGDQQLKKILLTDYLANYVKPGKHARLLVSKGLSRGIITRPFIAAVEVDGKKYKTDQVLFMGILKIALYSMAAFVLLFSFSVPLAVLACAGIALYYVRDYMDLRRF